MKIAVATNGETLEDMIVEEFEESTHLLIVETDDLSFEIHKNNIEKDKVGLGMTNIVKESDCEALIIGNIEQPAFELLADAQITRYRGAGYSAKDALVMMDNNRLQLIRNFKGGDETPHLHQNCSSNSHEE